MRVNHYHSLQKLPKITDVYSGVELRWAIGERIFDGSMQRHRHYANVYREVPVLKLRHEWADTWLGGDFRRQRTELSAEQRLWMGVFGRLDYQVTVGKLWSSVPFPVLYTPPTNIGLMHKHNTFQLLNPLEFVADELSLIHIFGLLSSGLLKGKALDSFVTRSMELLSRK